MKSAIWNDPKYADAKFRLIQIFDDGPFCDNCPNKSLNYFGTADGLALALCASCTQKAGKDGIVTPGELPRMPAWPKQEKQ